VVHGGERRRLQGDLLIGSGELLPYAHGDKADHDAVEQDHRGQEVADDLVVVLLTVQTRNPTAQRKQSDPAYGEGRRHDQ